MKKRNPVQTKTWQRLREHFERIRNVRIKDLFENDENRFEKFSLRAGDIFFDYSKNLVTEETVEALLALARELDLRDAIESMFNGEKINETEDRAVLHTALRNFSGKPVYADGADVMPEIKSVLDHMKNFSVQVRSGRWTGYTGKPISDIVNIGIGGSDLGPAMVAEALQFYGERTLNVHFVSNVDAAHIVETLKDLDPETTLFLISSKSFTTQETITNAYTARKWFMEAAVDEKRIAKHFVAISTNVEKVKEFGIAEENIFEFWDFVGGRFSVWSAIGLSIACYIGFDGFMEFLRGAHEMDNHFRNEPFERNIPVIMAMIGVWYNNLLDAETEAVIPYEFYLKKLPSYLQQSHMESNGKCVDRNGKIVDYNTSPVIWGESGINGQHAFFQLLHQGTRLVPATFLGPAIPLNDIDGHHDILLSNFLAQTEALMVGKTEEQVREELKGKGLGEEEIVKLLPFKVFEGSKPSTTILYRKLSPKTLGALVSLFEHKIFVQGIVWNIFSFDQWGVELGKKLAGNILSELTTGESKPGHDGSTKGLLGVLKSMRTL